jgi:hypothetical protein
MASQTNVLIPSAARTANGNGASVSGYGDTTQLRAQLNVTAAAGTSPSLTVLIEDTVDGVNWNTIGTFAAATGVAREVINVTTPYADDIRARWTVAGTTPSFTFSVIVHGQ